MFFPKNCAGIWSFLYYWEISNFFFPKTLSYPLDGKWKISFSKKYTEICFFLQMFWKDGLFKKDCAATWYFLHYQERWFFSPKTSYFLLGTKVRDDLFQEIDGNMVIFVYTCGCYKRGATLLCQKKRGRSYPPKINLKVIDVLDFLSRRRFSNSLYIHGDLYRRFYILLSSEEKQNKTRNLNIGLKFDFFFNLFGWRYSAMNNLRYYSALRRFVWGCAWLPIRETICSLGDWLQFQKYKSSKKNFLMQR